jgi:hypothetical protein
MTRYTASSSFLVLIIAAGCGGQESLDSEVQGTGVGGAAATTPMSGVGTTPAPGVAPITPTPGVSGTPTPTAPTPGATTTTSTPNQPTTGPSDSVNPTPTTPVPTATTPGVMPTTPGVMPTTPGVMPTVTPNPEPGVTPGTGGTAPMGMAGMPPVGTGGMPDQGTGGTATGGMPQMGMAGMPMQPEVLDPAVLIPDLDGFYWEGTCVGNRDAGGKNCPLDDNGASCPSGTSYDTRGTIRDTQIKFNGTPGQKYIVEIEVRGVAGTRCYTGGMRSVSTPPNPDGVNNTWYAGGVQTGDSWWNTYELHVEAPPVDGEPNVYYLNAFTENDQNWCQKEATYQVGYVAQFAVMGDSTIRLRVHDSNCQAQQNCGSDETSQTCNAPRTVDLTGMSPAATFAQPPTNQAGGRNYYPQWLYFDVRSITLGQ